MKKVLLVQPSLQPPGGGNGVAAWILEALKQEYAVSVLSWTPIEFAAVNAYYGTALSHADCTVYTVSPGWRRPVEALSVPLSLLKTSLLLRVCKQMKDDYDVLITANNEMDFGRTGIQYIHYPWNFQPRPPTELRWYHGTTAMVRAYYRVCYSLCGFSLQQMKQNLTLVNSDWIGAKVRECHGIDSTTLYPPAAGTFAEMPWEQRDNGFVCIGRICPEKELEKVIAIVAAVRSHGVKAHLHIVGSLDADWAYYQRIRQQAHAHTAWISLHDTLSRAQLTTLVSRQRYGIHGMREEHFGMAVAEMVRGGCIVFTPRSGGQQEIIGPAEPLLYETPEEAVAKIVRVMREPALQTQLRAHLAARQARFSSEHFMQRLREIVRNFPSPHAGHTHRSRASGGTPRGAA